MEELVSNSDLSYLDTVEPGKGIEKPVSTGVKMLTLVDNDDVILDKNSEEYNEEAEAGFFYVKSENLVIKTPARMVPLDYRQLYSEFEPKRGGFIRYVSMEEALRISKDPMKFGAQQTKAGKTLQENHSFVVMLPDYDNMVALIGFMSSRVPDGRAWNRRIANMQHGDSIIAMHNQVYDVHTKLKRDTKNSWFLIKPRFNGFVSLDEHKAITKVRSKMGDFQMPMLENSTSEETEAEGDY